MTYFMTSSFVKFVFADSQRFLLRFPVVDYVPAVLIRLLAAFEAARNVVKNKCKLPLIVNRTCT